MSDTSSGELEFSCNDPLLKQLLLRAVQIGKGEVQPDQQFADLLKSVEDRLCHQSAPDYSALVSALGDESWEQRVPHTSGLYFIRGVKHGEHTAPPMLIAAEITDSIPIYTRLGESDASSRHPLSLDAAAAIEYLGPVVLGDKLNAGSELGILLEARELKEIVDWLDETQAFLAGNLPTPDKLTPKA